MTDELSPAARALLRTARSFDDPSHADFRRVRASVLSRVGAAVGVGAALGASSSAFSFAGVAALLGTTAGKIGAAVVLFAGLSTGTYIVTRSPAPKRPPAVVASLPSAPAVESLALPPPVVEVAPRASTTRAETPSKARASAPVPSRAAHVRRAPADLEGEVRLLEEADAELRRGDAIGALVTLGEHAAKYPAGALVDEREGIRAIALCRAGRLAEGRAAADRFLSAARKSSLATRVRNACGIE
jgi:hypothetical protein